MKSTAILADQKCEICGKPATTGIRDLIRRDNYKTGWVDMKIDGPPHFFCEEHERESNIREWPSIF